MTRRTLLLVRWGIFLAACAFLYMRLSADQSTYAAWGDPRAALGVASWPFWAAMCGMAVLNWGVEAAKWRWLVSPLERIGIGRAFAATLAGTTIGLITPNRTGEFMGRVLFLAPEHRWQGGFATVLGSIAQFVTTVSIGGTAFAIWWWTSPPLAGMAPWGGVAMMVLVATVAGGALVLYLRPRLLRQIVLMVPLLDRMGGAAHVLEEYSTRELLAVLLMSMLRYLVFGAQYVLFLAVFTEVSWQATVVVVPVIYLITTLVPTMMLTELGVRGSVAVALLTPIGGLPAGVLLASFGVWAVNLALPAAVGAVILLMARIRTRS
ncbi:MAG: flippase-like domain-containing protein [Flavobacteriales bacterium]|jgi:hypothetical protein|nr:flippase-like domain-containing protein [Flavobacteriales bacterium]